MKIGIKLPNSGPIAVPEVIRQAAVTADELGFDSVWVHDHVTRSPADAEYHFVGGAWESWDRPIVPNVYESVSTLAFVAGCTSRVAIGTSVVVAPLRNPVWLAKTTASIDALAGGRFILGLGVGGSMYLERELMAMGAGHLYAGRGRVVNEWIDVMRGVWREPSFTHRGEFIDVVDAEVFPKPPRGSVPIWIAGASKPGMRRAGERGDGWLPMFMLPDELAAGIRQIRDIAEAAGRDGSQIALASEHWLAIDEDGDRAADYSAATINGMASYTANLPGASANDKDVAAGRGNFVGNPDQVGELLEAYQRAGVDHLVLRVIAPSPGAFLDSLALFKESVVDKVVSRSAV